MGRVAVVVLALICVACGQTATSQSTTRTIEIEMRDFAFSPESLTLRGGETVTLLFKNVGKTEHEFMAGSEPAYGKGYLKDWLAEAHFDADLGHDMAHAGVGIRVPPSTTKAVTFVVPNDGGVFEFGCFVIGHYESGMHGRLVVDATAEPSSRPGRGTGAPAQSGAPTHAPMGDDDGEGH